MKTLNLGIAFLLELCLLAAFGYWGFHASTNVLLQWSLGLGTPLLAAVLWGIVAAPASARRLTRKPRLLFALVLFTLGATALYASGQRSIAVVFEVVVLCSQILGFVWEQ